MNYQQMTLLDEPDSEQLRSYRGGSHASRIALQEAVKRLVTNVICGQSTGESLAKLSPDGSWLKMYGGYCQAKMDGSFEEYSGIFPTWGMMLDGVVSELPMSEQFMGESGLRLLPTPTASDFRGGRTKQAAENCGRSENNNYRDYCRQVLGLTYPSTEMTERIMGLPIGWTDLEH